MAGNLTGAYHTPTFADWGPDALSQCEISGLADALDRSTKMARGKLSNLSATYSTGLADRLTHVKQVDKFHFRATDARLALGLFATICVGRASAPRRSIVAGYRNLNQRRLQLK